MRRLFVAVWPPVEVLDRVAELERPAVAGLRWTGRDQWHVTLRFLGPVRDVDVDVVAAALGAMDPGGPATAVLGPGVARFGNRILHVPVAGLDAVAAAVLGATAHLGKPPEDRAFSGHLTLARVAKGSHVNLRAMVGAEIAAVWAVDAVCLVESRLSPAGARYRPLERFPLSANR